MDYQKNLSEEILHGEPTIYFGICENGKETEDCVQMPEVMVNRLNYLGCAYQLHISSMIEIYNENNFNNIQCQNLADELQFLSNVVNDPLFINVYKPVMKLIDKIKNNTSLSLNVIGN